MCAIGGEIYNIYDHPPKVPGRCDRDGGELIQRPDDREEVIAERLAAYERQTRPLVDYYRQRGVLKDVDGMAAAGGGNKERSRVARAEKMIVCKSAAELETMHRAGLVVWDVLNRLRQAVQPGVSTLDLEKIAAQGAQKHGARPAFKGYRGYPCVLCASINQEVVHGIPSGARRLKEGDIISLDFGVELDGYYGDAALTLPVGKIRPEICDLLRVTRESLDKAHREGSARESVERHLRIRAAMGGETRLLGGS